MSTAMASHRPLAVSQRAAAASSCSARQQCSLAGASRPLARQHQQPFLAGGGGGARQLLQQARRGAAAARRGGAPRTPVTTANLKVKEPATGVEFPLAQTFWFGETFRCCGAGARTKKVALFNVKVYAVSLYVEADKAAKELGVRARGGFFDDNRDEDFRLALVDGAFGKVLQIEMARRVDGDTFVAALQEALEPRLRLCGELGALAEFNKFFEGAPIDKGTAITLAWRQPDTLELLLRQGGQAESYADAAPGARINSPSLCRALFEVFMGSATVVPEAAAAWANGARGLLESEQVKRDTRKGG